MSYFKFFIGFYLSLVWIFIWSPSVNAEWLQQSCAFPHRIPVTLTASSAGHNAEIRIDLTNSDFPTSYTFSSSGDDIRVFESDDTTPVDYVIAGWDAIGRSATIYIRMPSMPPNTSEMIYIYLGDNSLGAGDTANIVFPDIGVRLRSRVSTADPTDAVSGRAAFEAALTDVYDDVRTTVSGLNNRALGGTNGDFGWCISAILNVTPATSGNWDFRYGGDFGRGGHLYVSGQALEEDWNNDLWWAGNYNNTAETLSGSITLDEGWHRYEALGFEGCCDGGVGFQARSPGGSWQDLSSTNFALRGAQCIAEQVTISIGAHESCSTSLNATKTVLVDSSSPSPYALPNSIMRYNLNIENSGQAVDAGTVVLTDTFPTDVALIVTPGSFTFADGTVTSGLGFVYSGPASTTDNVSFSIDGVNFTYTPTLPTDALVTHIRFSPTGTFNPNSAGNKPSFTISLLGEIL